MILKRVKTKKRIKEVLSEYKDYLFTCRSERFGDDVQDDIYLVENRPVIIVKQRRGSFPKVFEVLK